MAEVTSAESKDPPPIWQQGRGFYQARAGVHRPWICEIAPSQYASLSKRQRAEYDAKRSREWAASAECAEEYAQACLAAYDADPEILRDPEIHPDASDAIFWARRRREEAATKARFDVLSAENRVEPADVQVGDRVFWLLGGRYLTVTKKSKASLRGVCERGEEHKAAIRACQWLHYNELQEAAKAGKTTIKPR